MRQRGVVAGSMQALLIALLLGIVLCGCATTPKIDWNGRIGNYTYDQAVMELGPPDRMAPLTDGTRVGEWLTSRGYSQGYITGFAPPYYGYRYGYGPPAYYYSEPPAPDRFIRLVFGPDGKLVSWQKVIR